MRFLLTSGECVQVIFESVQVNIARLLSGLYHNDYSLDAVIDEAD